jgi:hypothetical protein
MLLAMTKRQGVQDVTRRQREGRPREMGSDNGRGKIPSQCPLQLRLNAEVPRTFVSAGATSVRRSMQWAKESHEIRVNT